MDNRVRYTKEWLKANQLVPGRIYLAKDGRLMLYLGMSLKGMFLFYVLASAYLECTDRISKCVTYENYDWQILELKTTINNIMNHTGNRNSLLDYKNVPKLYGEFPFLWYEDTYKMWYNNSFNNAKVPSIASTKEDIKTGFVSVKDLVPGNLYYSGQCWRSCYVYLGRKSTKEFIWYFIGNESILMESSAIQLLRNSETTKNNKKVKPLKLSLTDKNAYISEEVKHLIKLNYKVDMSGVTQEMLDLVR